MTKFLDAIAAYYHEKHEWQLFNYTFVFPNQRSSNFFKKSMNELCKDTPELASYRFITMAELMEKTAELRRATPNRLLIWLYVAYCRIRRKHGQPDGNVSEPEEFDRFRFWGEMLLRDFDQIDRHLVDYRQLFKNVRDFKELQATYLTEEQLDIIRTYWGDDPYWGHLDDAPASGDDDERPFWRHICGPDGAEGRFAMLWQMLGEVYEEFGHMLRASRLCYPGMAYRIVADRVRRGNMRGFSARDYYVFVGFSDLSPAELTLFRSLLLNRQADFFWDYDPDLMGPEGCAPAGNAVRRYIEKFPQPTEFSGIRPQHHDITIIATPSNVGQVHCAIQHLTPASALVMPSDDLLLTVLSSLPGKEFTEVAVSMGYPVRQSDIASLFAQTVSLQMRLIKHSDGSLDFFREDVMAILAHPLISARYNPECQAVIDYLTDNAEFNLPAIAVVGSAFEALAPVFTPVDNSSDVKAVMEYFDRLMEFMAETLGSCGKDSDSIRALDLQICRYLQHTAAELRTLIEANPEVTMRRHTFFHLIESSLFRRPVQISDRGATDGLQVLGMLETRCLSFDNVVMLSMSDRIYPGKRFMHSFVPVTLRRGFGLPGPEVAEAAMAYNFYRLLSHASTATLIFDSRTGLYSGDMSRFLYQLRFIRLKNTSVRYESAIFSPVSLQSDKLPSGSGSGIVKTPEIMKRINRLRDIDCLHSNALSASALKMYINCPLSFYLQHIADIKVPDAVTDDVDSPTLGSVFHSVAELLYCGMRDAGMNPITHSAIKREMNKPLFDDHIRYSINLHKVKIPRMITDADGQHVPNPELHTRNLSQENQLLAQLIREMIKVMTEREPASFTFRHAEYSARWQWSPMEGNCQPFNFTMSIDRIDSTTINEIEHMRIIDYKTGTENLGFNNVESLFGASVDEHVGGAFQLLLYCCAYADRIGDHSTPILPLIYGIKEIATKGIGQLKYGENPRSRISLNDYHELENEFRACLAAKINELFNPDIPFTRCDGTADGACRYCKFKKICGVI
ncbi:MAG: PD-(D/E)XK nuclease family protein [Muribaculaceae bacterium]|nr:PD-(D/E)XK nuclease family protein [Muribaculaceae bacterium]